MRQQDDQCFHCLTKSGPSFIEDECNVHGKLIQLAFFKKLRSFDHETKRYSLFLLSQKFSGNPPGVNACIQCHDNNKSYFLKN